MFGLCAVITLIVSGVVLSDEARSIIEQNDSPDAAQAVESAINASESQPIQEALPEEEVLPENEAIPEASGAPVLTPSDVVEDSLSNPSQAVLPGNPTLYIIGVIVSPVPPMVQAQVDLPENSGVFIQTIKPNGPAAQAGVLQYDIIVAIDGIAISDSNGLAAELQKAAGKPQKLTVLRHGKKLTLDITAQPFDASRQLHSLPNGIQIIPTPQPYNDPLAPNYDPDDDEDDAASFPRLQRFIERQRLQMEQMRQRMEAMENAMRQGMPGFTPFVPGPGAAPAPAPAPDPNGGALTLPPQQLNAPNAQIQSNSFSVQVQKNGNEPALIKIQDNGDEYLVDENSIDQLPENVRNRLNFKIQTNDK